jgi:WD40 repeat protein
MVMSAKFSPDGREIVSSSSGPPQPDGKPSGGEIKVWNAVTGAERITLRHERTASSFCGFRSASFSPDGKWIVAARDDHVIQAWDAVTGQTAWTLHGHTDAVNAVIMSLDGRTVASASHDQTVRLWDTHTAREIRRMHGHSGHILSVAFSPDEQRLVSVSGGQYRSGAFLPSEVKLWDAATGQEIVNLRGTGASAIDVSFSPDGYAIASADIDGTVTIWEARPLSYEERTRRQAAMFARYLFDQDLTNEQVKSRIRQDLTIDDALRHEALHCADVLQKIAFRREAEKVVRELYGKLMFKPAVIESLRSDKTLPDSVRKEALSQAERSAESPVELDHLSFSLVRVSTASAADYRLALKQAEIACYLLPLDGKFLPFEGKLQTTLGLAQYRVGDYQAALATLTRANAINSSQTDGASPADLAFLAMAHFRLGQFDKARIILTQLREVVKRPQWAGNLDAQAFLHEAETLLQDKPAS